MQKWEYCWLREHIGRNSTTVLHYLKEGRSERKELGGGKAAATIAELGLEGWELVNVNERVHEKASSFTMYLTYYFKRPVP